MKIRSYLFPVCALAIASAQLTKAESLDNEAKQELIETLKEILRGNKSRETSAIATALDAFRSAAMDDKAAYALYENCIRKKEFTEKDKSESEWRKWKNDNKEKAGDIVFRKALQYQFQWAVITLQAASAPKESFDPSQYAPQIISMLESIGSNFKELKKRKGELGSNILQGPVGEIYAVSQIQPEKWPGSLMDIGSIFDSLVFEKYRKERNISGLRSAWDKRISIEAQFMETKDEDFEQSTPAPGKDDKDKKKKSSSSLSSSRPSSSSSSMSAVKLSTKNSSNAKDLTRAAFEKIASLRWQREVDCCKIGDETQASANMLNIIKATRDPKQREVRIQELLSILMPKSKKGMGENSAFGSTAPSGADDSDYAPTATRSTRKSSRVPIQSQPVVSSAPSASIPSGDELPPLQEEKKSIIPIVEEVVAPKKAETSSDKPNAPSEASSESTSPTSSTTEEKKVNDDFFEE